MKTGVAGATRNARRNATVINHICAATFNIQARVTCGVLQKANRWASQRPILQARFAATLLDSCRRVPKDPNSHVGRKVNCRLGERVLNTIHARGRGWRGSAQATAENHTRISATHLVDRDHFRVAPGLQYKGIEPSQVSDQKDVKS